MLDPAIEGLSAREIATRLSLAEATVRSHLSTIYSKLGVAGRVELLARMNGGASTPSRPSEDADRIPAPIADDNPSPTPTGAAPGGQPIRRRRRFAAAVSVVLVLLAATVIVITRTDLPPRTDLATVSSLLADRQISAMEVRDQSVIVTERSGARLMVEDIPVFGVEPLVEEAIAASVEVRVVKSPPWPPVELVLFAGAVVPLVVFGVAAIVIVWIVIRRRPTVHSAG